MRRLLDAGVPFVLSSEGRCNGNHQPSLENPVSSIQVSKPIETKSRPTNSKPHAHINISHTTSFCKKEENVVVGVGVSLIGGGDILGDRMLHS